MFCAPRGAALRIAAAHYRAYNEPHEHECDHHAELTEAASDLPPYPDGVREHLSGDGSADHPGQTAEDYESVGSCVATAKEARDFERWSGDTAMSKPYAPAKPLRNARGRVKTLLAAVPPLKKSLHQRTSKRWRGWRSTIRRMESRCHEQRD